MNSGELQSFIKQLRGTQYDMIVDVQGGFKSAFLARLAKGPHAGHDQRGVHDWGAQFFYQKRFTVPKGMHSILRMRRLLAGALGYTFQEADLDYGIVRTRLARPILEFPEPYLVFIHSTSWASKVWPEAYWKELVQQAVAKGFYVLLPWGDEAERQRSLRIAGADTRAIVLPQLSISEKAGIISGAKGTVGLDTGLSHIAAALGIPSVTIYGATDPRLVGATGQRQVHVASRFECVRCHQTECTYQPISKFKPACLVETTPQVVWQSVEGLVLGVG